MKYETLTESDLHKVARERVRLLETDHFAWKLRLAEAEDPAEVVAISKTITDLERRIAVHVVDDAEADPMAPGGSTALPDGSTSADGMAATEAMRAHTGGDGLNSDTTGRGEPTTHGCSLDDGETQDR